MYRKTKAQIISDAVCGVLMLLSLLVFMLVGILANVWHPTWIIIPSSGFICGMISIIVNTYANLHRQEEVEIKTEDKESKESKKK